MKRFIFMILAIFASLNIAAAPLQPYSPVKSYLTETISSADSTFDPYSSANTPPLGVFVVKPLPLPSIYIPAYAPFIGRFFPATWFLQTLNLVSATTGLDCVTLNGNWLEMLQKLNGPAWNYLHNGSDGYMFNGNKLCAVTSPGNKLNILQAKYRGGQWWGRVGHYAYSTYPPTIDPSTAPDYLLNVQTNENSYGRVIDSPEEVGFQVYVPVIADKDIWIPYSQLVVDTLVIQYEVVNTGGWNLNLRDTPSVNGNVIAHMPEYSIVTYVSTSQDKLWLEVEYNGRSGWASMSYLTPR